MRQCFKNKTSPSPAWHHPCLLQVHEEAAVALKREEGWGRHSVGYVKDKQESTDKTGPRLNSDVPVPGRGRRTPGSLYSRKERKQTKGGRLQGHQGTGSLCSPRSTRKVNTTGRAQSSEQKHGGLPSKGWAGSEGLLLEPVKIEVWLPRTSTRRRHSPAWYIHRKGTQHIFLKISLKSDDIRQHSAHQ